MKDKQKLTDAIAAIAAVRSGNPVSDSELANGIAFLREVLFVYGNVAIRDRFYLFVMEVHRSLEVLESYAMARGKLKEKMVTAENEG